MKLRLQARYSLIILLIVVSVIIVLAGVNIFQFRISLHEMTRASSETMEADLLEQLKKRGEVLTLFLAEDLINPVYQYDMETIYDITKAAKEQKDVIYVYVYDRMGRIIHDGTDENPLLDKISDDEVSKKAVVAKRLILQTTEDALDVASPIKIHNELLGGVRIGFSLKGIATDIEKMKDNLGDLGKREMQRTVFVIAMMASGLSIIGIILAVIVARSLSRPISLLSVLTARIGGGEYDVDIPIKRSDEIGELATSFKKMTQDLNTSRDELIASRDYTDNIVKSMIDTLLVVDPEGKIKTINPATVKLLGYKEDELIDKPVATVFEEEEEVTPFKGTRMKKLIEEGSIRDYDMTYKTKSGEKIPVSFSGSVMRDKEGEIVGIVGIARDMREIRRLINDLEEARTGLERQVEERTAVLKKREEELRKRMVQLEKFTKVAVGRELKMKQMEKELKILKEELAEKEGARRT